MSTNPTQLVTHQFDDHGLDHNHAWVGERRHGSGRGTGRPVGSDTALLTTTSSALHDDIHYGR